MKIEAKNLLEAYNQTFHSLLNKGSFIPTADKELLSEDYGVVVVSNPMSLLSIKDNKIHGVENDNLSMIVKEHYEKIILSSGKLNDVTEFLIHNSNSKRAVLDVWSNEGPCLVYLWFRIQDGHLICAAHMRANDVYNKMLLNMQIFVAIQTYIAKKLNLKIGEYRHYCDSFHFYQRDKDKIVGTYL